MSFFPDCFLMPKEMRLRQMKLSIKTKNKWKVDFLKTKKKKGLLWDPWKPDENAT